MADETECRQATDTPLRIALCFIFLNKKKKRKKELCN